MEEISSRPERDELASYVPQKMYQPIFAWVVFGIITFVAVLYILIHGKAVEQTITTSGRNAQSAADLQQPLRKNRITSYDDCVAAGFPVSAEDNGNECFTPDGNSFSRSVLSESDQ